MCGRPAAGFVAVHGRKEVATHRLRRDDHMSTSAVRRDDAGATADYAGAEASTRGTGWVTFAAILLFLAGIWNVIDGVAAISTAHVYPAGTHYVFSDLNTWGWIVLALGIVQLAAGASLTTGTEWAKWFAILVTGVNAIGQLLFLPAYPFWALSMFTLDVLIIYGLAVYGGVKVRQV
jgi:hypothetical protein